ncbi:MAG: hypothetical protein HFG40_00215 [Bacilli bacterium]|nr:hypothetical protein [Bacilli bacterium]
MEALMEFFPIVIYCLAIALMILLMVFIVKLMHTVDRVNRILDDVERKTRSLNGLFHVIDSVTDTLSVFSDTLVSGITGIVGKIWPKGRNRKRKKDKEMDDYE